MKYADLISQKGLTTFPEIKEESDFDVSELTDPQPYNPVRQTIYDILPDDEYPEMNAWENTVAWARRESKIIPEVTKAGARGLLGFGSTMGKAIYMIGDSLSPTDEDAELISETFKNRNINNGKRILDGIKQFGLDVSDQYQYWQTKVPADKIVFGDEFMKRPSFTRAISLAVESVPLMGSAFIAAVATKNPLMTYAIMGGATASDVYKEARDTGISKEQAFAAGASAGVGEALIERYLGVFNKLFGKVGVVKPVGKMAEAIQKETAKLAGKSALNKFAIKFVANGAQEGLTEATQQIYTNWVRKLGIDDTIDLTEGLIESVIAGALSGGLIGGVTPTTENLESKINELVERGKVSQAEVDGFTESIGETLSNNSEIVSEVIQEAYNGAIEEANSQQIEEFDVIEEVADYTLQLPKILKNAKPRYNYGRKSFLPQFDSNIDLALYITAQKNPSSRDEEYRQFLRDAGFSDEDIDLYGTKIREKIKAIAKDSAGGDSANPEIIRIEPQNFKIRKKVPKQKQIDTQAQLEATQEAMTPKGEPQVVGKEIDLSQVPEADRPLYEEALKYDSAEEFIKEQQNLRKAKQNEIINTKSELPEFQKDFSSIKAKGTEQAMKKLLPTFKGKNVTIEKLYTDIEGKTTFGIKQTTKVTDIDKFNKFLLSELGEEKTKSQLTDIYNKAQELKQKPAQVEPKGLESFPESERALYEEALKYDSAEEFVSKKNTPEQGKIYLYRGLEKKFDPKYDATTTDAPNGYSTWTDNPELARQYAGEKGYIYKIELPADMQGQELIDEDGERALFIDNEKKAGLNNINGKEYLVYTGHDDYSNNLISETKTQQEYTDIYNKAQELKATANKETAKPEKPIEEVKPNANQEDGNKVTRLAERMAEDLYKKYGIEIKEEDLAKYQVKPDKEQLDMALSEFDKDMNNSFLVALGVEPAKKGILPTSYLVMAEKIAEKTNNVDMLMQLSNSQLAKTASEYGQFISMLRNIETDSPLKSVQAVANEKVANYNKVNKESAEKTIKKEKKKVTETLEQAYNEMNSDFQKFIKDMEC